MSSPGPENRPAWADPAADRGSLRASGNGTAGGDQARRANGRRAPGAHRASKPDGLIPGFGRLRGRDERNPGKMPEPYPADVPLGGEAGLKADGYGVSTEGDLTEAEFARAGWPAQPAQHARAAQPAAAAAASPASAASPSLVRSSGVMALGTLASRVTGLLRNMLLLYALGSLALGNAYNYANTLPNTVYNLAIGGILTSVIVPLLVNAAKRDTDRGEGYDQRMFTLVTLALGAVTLIAMLLAAPIALLYDHGATGNERHLVVIFAYFFIPQIFFYGVSSLAGAILNARGHFAAPMWTPVVNNLVVILVAVTFLVIAGVNDTVAGGAISTAEIWLIGIGTTLGIVAQTAALVPALRRVGFRWRPRLDFRRSEVGEIGRMSGWMLGYVLTTQVAFLVTSIVASTASKFAQQHHIGVDFTAYSNAWLLFQLPYAIVAISVITALLPRMSANAADRRYDLVRADFSSGVRLGSVIVVPAALVLAAIGPPLAEILLGWGNTSDASARYLGLVFSIFSIGLVPYMLFQLLLRVFYSTHDSKTPALIGIATMVTNVGANLIALYIFSPKQVIAALGAGFGLANLVGAVIAWRVLSRRLGGLAGRQIGGSLIRMHLAALPAAIFALLVAVITTSVFSSAKVYAAAIVVVGGGGAVLLYVTFSRLLRVSEVTDLVGMVRSRLGR